MTAGSSTTAWPACSNQQCRSHTPPQEAPVSTALVTDLTIFVHTPLMSATNSIHGIVLAGALLIGVTADNVVGYILAFIASFFAAANVVGGYVVTERMLKMFRRKAPQPQPELEGLDGHKGLKGLTGKIGKARP